MSRRLMRRSSQVGDQVQRKKKPASTSAMGRMKTRIGFRVQAPSAKAMPVMKTSMGIAMTIAGRA